LLESYARRPFERGLAAVHELESLTGSGGVGGGSFHVVVTE
jgi:hypothetical protein